MKSTEPTQISGLDRISVASIKVLQLLFVVSCLWSHWVAMNTLSSPRWQQQGGVRFVWSSGYEDSFSRFWHAFNSRMTHHDSYLFAELGIFLLRTPWSRFNRESTSFCYETLEPNRNRTSFCSDWFQGIRSKKRWLSLFNETFRSKKMCFSYSTGFKRFRTKIARDSEQKDTSVSKRTSETGQCTH